MLKKAIMSYKWYAALSLLMITVVVASALLQPHYLKDILKAVLENDKSQITQIGIGLLGIAGFGLLAGTLNTILAAKIAQGVSADIREQTFRKIQSFSYANVEAFNAGNLVVRMTNDVNQIQNLVMMIFQVLLRLPLLFIGAFFMAVQTLPKLWWILVLMVILIIVIMGLVMSQMGPRFGIFQKLMDKINRIAKENLRGVRVVKSFVQEKEQYEKFKEISNELLDLNLFIGYGFSLMQPAMMLVSYMAIYFSIYLVSGMVKTEPTVIGNIASFMTYMGQIIFSIMMVGFMGMQASRAFVSIRRINEILETEPAMSFDTQKVEDLNGRLAFEDVSFTYPDDSEATLKHISFTAEPGQMIGVVGSTGSGKSTLAQLIPRLFDPQEGRILIDDRPLKSLSKETLRQTVSIVLQKAILFSGTIADNLRQGKSSADESALAEAARIAQAHEFIERMTDGYESQVEERGNNFSGGQKQRLSIARGIIKEPKILILDDSTSALDNITTRKVINNIKNNYDCSTILISQKIGAIKNADNIMVLTNGAVMDQGKHGHLIKTCDFYQKIYETQLEQ